MSKVWFVTGASRGFGREFVEAALERGDRVAATARRTESLNDLVDKYGETILPLQLDVTDPVQTKAAVTEAHQRFGRLDVVVNNAGYGLFGAFEEVSEQQLRQQFETNLFGVFHVTRAVLPILRTQGSGHIVQISTIAGVTTFPLLSAYHASKWALEGMTESLAQEVAGFGVKVTLVEPGGFATDWAGSSAVWADPVPEYQALREAVLAAFQDGGVPRATPRASAPLSSRSSMPTSPRCASSSVSSPARRSRTSTPSAWPPGPNGRRSRSRPTARTCNHADVPAAVWTRKDGPSGRHASATRPQHAGLFRDPAPARPGSRIPKA